MNEKQKLRNVLAGGQSMEVNPCSTCGATFIESFPGRQGWWVGCKSCDRALRNEHVHGDDAQAAVEKWNKRNPTPIDATKEQP